VMKGMDSIEHVVGALIHGEYYFTGGTLRL